MKRKNMNQKEYGFTHTKQRLKERYNLNISHEEYDYLCNKVRKGKYSNVVGVNTQKTGEQKIVGMLFKERLLILVWEEHRDCITTALPYK